MILAGNLEAEAGFDVWLVPIDVVYLQLEEIELVPILRENFVQQRRHIVEGHADLPNLPLGLFPDREVEDLELPALFIDIRAHVVQQIAVKERDAAVLELFRKDALQILFAL